MTDQVNIPLLRKAVEWAEAEAAKPMTERRWMQCQWVSDPSDVAWELAWEQLGEGATRDRARLVAAELEPLCGTAYCIASYIGQSIDARYATSSSVDGVHVSDFAASALGIDLHGAAGDLFQGSNTIEDVRRIAESLAGERL